MAGFKQGDVVRVPFPYTNQQTTQHRPALVVSDGALGDTLLWVAMITSAENRPWPGDVDLKDDLKKAGLPVPSVVRTMKVATIDASLASALGAVNAKTCDAVMVQVRRHLAL